MGKRSAIVAEKRAARSALVSVVVSTYSRPELLTQRCIPSILAQTHTNLDIHIVGDGCDEETLNKMVELIALFKDDRVRLTNRPRPEYPQGELDAWHVSGSHAVNYGLDSAKGKFVCCVADDDAIYPEFVEALVDALVEQQAGLAYCVSEIIKPDGSCNGYLGCDFPPQFARQAAGEFLWRRNSVRLDPECWRRGLPNDWDYVSRMMAAGLRPVRVPRVLYSYFPGRHIPQGYPTPR